MSTLKQIGEKLHLNLQLYDAGQTLPKRVFVDLYEGDGTLILADYELTHIDGGLFTEDTQVMPNIETVIARYSVFESDGTTPSLIHSEASERYERDVPLELPEAIIPKPFAITARIRTPRLKVRVRDE